MKEKKEKSLNSIHVIFLFCFLVIVVASFFMILLDDRQPKQVTLNLEQVAQNDIENIPEAPTIKTELLQPRPDPVTNTPPVAQFIAKTPVVIGEKVEFEDQSYDKDLGGSIVNWHWEGKKDIYVKAGDYTVTLRVQDDQGAWSEPVSHVIHVLETPTEKYNMPPIAIFKATNPVYVGENVIYEDGSYDADGSSIINRRWEGNQTNFGKAGFYRVSLTVQDDKGKWSDPVFQVIEVKERPIVEVQRKPIAIFDVTSPAYVGQQLVYTNKSFDQDSGDRIIKTEWSANKQNSYTKPGKYEITLRVQDNHGEWSEPFKRVIEVIDSPNMPPIANFETNSPVYINQKVDWKNTSYDEDGIVAKEQWGGDKRYMYTQAGEYNVTLTVWDERGARSSITKKIVVLNNHNKAPVCKFHTNSPVSVGEKVYFWDDSFDEDGTITKSEWSGDKRDVYNQPGKYQITLTVWDNNGQTSSTTQQIEVLNKTNQKPVARISGPTEIHVNQTIVFKDESYDPDGYIVSNSWGSSTLSKTWDKPGAYYVDLEVMDNRGEKTIVGIAVYVRDINYPIGK